MHELSIVNSLIDLCEKVAHKNGATKVLRVEVRLGKLSGIEPHFFEITFDTFKEKTICENAELVVKLEDIKIACFECGETSELTQNEFVCPKCGSYEVKMIEGEDMILQNLEME
ncbi:MAG: hydrogenase maturation nickel metallochaperone HypA [Campylobacteraceae bacterium]